MVPKLIIMNANTLECSAGGTDPHTHLELTNFEYNLQAEIHFQVESLHNMLKFGHGYRWRWQWTTQHVIVMKHMHCTTAVKMKRWAAHQDFLFHLFHEVLGSPLPRYLHCRWCFHTQVEAEVHREKGVFLWSGLGTGQQWQKFCLHRCSLLALPRELGGELTSISAERSVNKLLTGYVSSSNQPAIHSCGNLSTTY